MPHVPPRRRIALFFGILLLTLGSISGAWALAVCVEQHNASGCLMSVGCDYYDDVTGAFRGSVRVTYHCPIAY